MTSPVPEKACMGCGAQLKPALNPSSSQFDNALWIGFHGGYGMFVDNIAATVPVNTDDSQWLRDANGNIVTDDEGDLVYRPDWIPAFKQPRELPGQPDYEAVICHACAHELCDKVPWIRALLAPHKSHSHDYATDWTGHTGWDLPHKLTT